MSQSTDELHELMMTRLRALAHGKSAGAVDRSWNDMYEAFNAAVNSKTNIITKTVFEEHYSKFFSRENAELMKKYSPLSPEFNAWKNECETFIREVVDPYRPIVIVDDADTEKVLKIFPPLFRVVDSINPPKQVGDKPSGIMDELNNRPYTIKEVTELAGGFFEKYAADSRASRREESKKLMVDCIAISQDTNRMASDVDCTTELIKMFYAQGDDVYGKLNDNKNETDNTEVHETSEAYGITFD